MQSLRELRLSRGLNMSDLEQSLGICKALLSESERGISTPNKLTRNRIEYYFGERINWLDVPKLKISPRFPTSWDSTELAFRGVIRLIAGLPEEEKTVFTRTAVKQLRKLLR